MSWFGGWQWSRKACYKMHPNASVSDFASKKQKTHRLQGITCARIKQWQTVPNLVFCLLNWRKRCHLTMRSSFHVAGHEVCSVIKMSWVLVVWLLNVFAVLCGPLSTFIIPIYLEGIGRLGKLHSRVQSLGWSSWSWTASLTTLRMQLDPEELWMEAMPCPISGSVWAVQTLLVFSSAIYHSGLFTVSDVSPLSTNSGDYVS